MSGYGVVRWTMAYDARGNMVEEAYFGLQGEPVLGGQGYARQTVRWGPRGELVEKAFWGLDGRPILSQEGFARETQAHDQESSQVRIQTFDMKGKRLDDFIQDDGAHKRALATIGALRGSFPEHFQGAAGVVVTAIYTDSQAARLDIRIGDILVRYGKTPLQGTDGLHAAIRDTKRKAKLVFIRGEAQMSVKVKPGPLGVRTGDL